MLVPHTYEEVAGMFSREVPTGVRLFRGAGLIAAAAKAR
jgi:hypothetical protein